MFLPGKCLDPVASGASRAGDNLMLHSIRVAYPPTNCGAVQTFLRTQGGGMRRREMQESLFHALSIRTKATAQKYLQITHDIFKIFINIHCVTTVSVTNIINPLKAGFKFTGHRICSILILINVKCGHNCGNTPFQKNLSSFLCVKRLKGTH